jgi:RND family efflux transporter MFP subunit
VASLARGFLQLVLMAGLLGGALAAWAVWVPSSHALLDRAGLLSRMAALGLPVAREVAAVGPSRPGAGGPPRAAAVVAATVEERELRDRLAAIGTAEALRSVSLVPEVSGRLAQIGASAGQYVVEGTVLARLDTAAEEIARDRALLQLEQARSTAARLGRLQATGTATEVQIRDAELAVQTAQLALRQAEFELSRRQVVAPFAGWIGLVEVEVGGAVNANTPIVRLDDRSVLVVDFSVPERFVGRIAVGDELTLSALAQPDTRLTGRVLAVDNRVDQASRSLRVQAEIENEGDFLRPGMAFGIEMTFAGRSYPAVPALAIQWSNEGAFVWVIRDGRVQRATVRILQRGEGLALVQGAIEPGEQVVTEGVQTLRPGTQVAPRAAPGHDPAPPIPEI